MRFLDRNWREMATKHYSTWALYLLAFLTLLPTLIYVGLGVDTNPVIWGRWQLAVAAFGIIGKFIIQTERGKWMRRMIIFGLLFIGTVVSVPALASERYEPEFDQASFDLIARWEGKRNHAYQDIVGVWTICYGHTRTARAGQYKSDGQCRDLLREEINEYRAGLSPYFLTETKLYRLPPLREAAYTSLAYNVGISGAGRSTAVRRLNRGDVMGGCNALTWWNKAGGRIVRGLVRRRTEERIYCLRGDQ